MTSIEQPVTEADVSMTVNGKPAAGTVDVRLLLVDFLRDRLRLTGTHVGCEHGVCGACTVLLDGESVRSCIMFAVQAEGSEIVTVEGITPESGLSPLQQAFKNNHALQCGFCTPGFLITIEAADPAEYPDDAGIREMLSGNLCRCTGYEGIVDAVKEAWGRQT
jgi:carbon-monoxide dehydrogenase small subunit